MDCHDQWADLTQMCCVAYTLIQSIKFFYSNASNWKFVRDRFLGWIDEKNRIKTSHHHNVTPSHHHRVTNSQHHNFTPSQLHIITTSHHHSTTTSQCHTITTSHHHSFTTSQLHSSHHHSSHHHIITTSQRHNVTTLLQPSSKCKLGGSCEIVRVACSFSTVEHYQERNDARA